MCEQSQAVLNLFRFAEIERGVEVADIDREPLVGSDKVIERLMKEYECTCEPEQIRIPNSSKVRYR